MGEIKACLYTDGKEMYERKGGIAVVATFTTRQGKRYGRGRRDCF